MTNNTSIESLLAAGEQEMGRYKWRGTFADYLAMVQRNPSISRLSHALVHDAIMADGLEETTSPEPSYGLFKDEIFGLEYTLDRIVRYLASSAQRLEVRKRILLLLGPPASGKSTVVDLIKRSLERYTRTDGGSIFAIEGCPMQEEPLHLIPASLRPELLQEHGVYVEGALCPRCRYVLRTEYQGRISDVPVSRVVFSESEAVGIGYYVATNPNPSDASLLVGSVNSDQLDGDRMEVAGKAFRLDGEFNVANRGLVEFVEIFKADRHLLTTLLGLAQEQLIKLEKFGSVYADETIIGHSNEGDFDSFSADEHSEALKDRIIAIHVPYNLKVHEEVKIYRKMLKSSTVQDVHVAPLTLPVVSTYAVFSRLDPPTKQGMSLIEKLRLYDGQVVGSYTRQDTVEMQRHNPKEGMSGLSPRYVMNRLGSVTSSGHVACLSPLAALNSLWDGLKENVSLEEEGLAKYAGFVVETVREYGAIAARDVQRAHDESFEQTAALTLEAYLNNVAAFSAANGSSKSKGRSERSTAERDMKELERVVRVTERSKAEFRREIHEKFSSWKEKGLPFDYTTEPRLRAAIEDRLLVASRRLEQDLSEPRFAKRKAEWAARREAILNRLINLYGYCQLCADDTLDYVLHALRSKPVVKTPRNEGLEWQWPLDPAAAADRPT